MNEKKQIFFSTNDLETEDDLIECLTKVNEKCDWVWKIYAKYVLIGFGASTVGSCLGSVLSFMLSDDPFDTENMYLQFKIVYAIIILDFKRLAEFAIIRNY